MDKQNTSKQIDKQSLQTLKGFRDFLPADAKKRQFLLNKLTTVFEKFGFEPLETPALEYEELLSGKYGDEGEKLMYKFTDNGGRRIALRYDQTVPTARVLATNQQELPMPFRRYQIQNTWRADKPQSGRYREFLMCDADIYGTLSPIADAEIISLADTIYKNLGFTDYKIYINDRNILLELMDYASIPKDLHFATIAAIDKLDRKSKDEIKNDLTTLGLEAKKIDHLYHHLDEAMPTERLNQVIDKANKLGVDSEKLIFEARLARGLDYYTSTIFEIKIEGYKGGSVLGGGRYDNLIEQLSGIKIPAVGFGLGFDRTLEAMKQPNLFPQEGKRNGVLVSVFNDGLLDASLEVSANLREKGIVSEVYPDENTKLDKQLRYADKKLIKWFVVIGPVEFDKDKVILKDLETGHQEDIKLDDLIKKVEGSK
jgi:histidyl-tRNA synthetase